MALAATTNCLIYLYNLHYEKFQDGSVKCIEDEIPFEIPEGWEWARLKGICSMVAGKSKSSSDIKAVPFDNCYPCFGGNGIRGFVDEYNYNGTYNIIGRQGALCGNINIASGKFYATEHAVVVTLFSGIDFKWSNFFLEGLNLNQYSTAVAQPGLSVANILKVFVPVPPQNEQVCIGNIIHQSLMIIDYIANEQINLFNQINMLKSRILDLAIQGKLVPQDPNDEPASVLLERIRVEKEELIKQGKIKRDKKESVIFKGCDNSYYETVPTNWEEVSLSAIAEIELGKTLDAKKNTGEMLPYLRNVNILWNNIDLSDIKKMRFEQNEVERYSIMKGDLLICEGGDVGRCSVWEREENIFYQNALHRVRFYGDCNVQFFVYTMLYLESIGYLKRISNGVTIKHLTKNILTHIPFLLPPLAEQHRIVAVIEIYFSILDKISNCLSYPQPLSYDGEWLFLCYQVTILSTSACCSLAVRRK